jgi:hypothetical protein
MHLYTNSMSADAKILGATICTKFESMDAEGRGP